MANKTAQQTEDLLTLYTTTLLDMPLAGTKLGLGMGQEREVMEAAWKGYDAWVRLMNASVDNLYRNPLFGDVMARSLDRWLRWQRLSQAMTGAFFAALWPAVGLPTAAAVQAVHEALYALDTRVKSQNAAVQSLRAELQDLETLRDELRSVAAGRSTQSPSDQFGIELAERRAALPTHSNGNDAVHNGTRTALQKKFTNGHAVKDGRKNDAVAH